MGSDPDKPKPPCHVIVFNIGKKANVGTIARCCTAFGVESVCLIGSRQFNTFGSHGSDAHVHFRHFDTLDACCERLRGSEGCKIVGIEIMDEAVPVHAHPFSGPTAFMLGNEGQVRCHEPTQKACLCTTTSSQGPSSPECLTSAAVCSAWVQVWDVAALLHLLQHTRRCGGSCKSCSCGTKQSTQHKAQCKSHTHTHYASLCCFPAPRQCCCPARTHRAGQAGRDHHDVPGGQHSVRSATCQWSQCCPETTCESLPPVCRAYQMARSERATALFTCRSTAMVLRL